MHVMVWISVCVCVWMNVDETEKAALCIAVHHRQYPCFSSIHIHTPFSYPLQEQEKSANVFECTAKKDLSQKKNRKGKMTERKVKVKKRGKKGTHVEKLLWGVQLTGKMSFSPQITLTFFIVINASRGKSKYSSGSDECCNFALSFSAGERVEKEPGAMKGLW